MFFFILIVLQASVEKISSNEKPHTKNKVSNGIIQIKYFSFFF